MNDLENPTHKEEKKDLSLNKKYHRHDYETVENFLICKECGKKILNLKQTEKNDLLIGVKRNGSNYSVRTDRRRYFFPEEWMLFINQIKNKEHKFFFITCLHTGGRIMEILNLRHKDIDIERSSVNFSIIKQRKAKKNFFATGKTRGFFVSSEFIKEYKSFIRGKTINQNHYIFLDNNKLPENYDKLENNKRKPYYNSKIVSYSSMLKRKLKKIMIKDRYGKEVQIDWYNFSPHNIRKTYGMWMRTLVHDMGELCYRMGHDIDTYIAHYGSSLIFTDNERRGIQKIMGEVK